MEQREPKRFFNFRKCVATKIKIVTSYKGEKMSAALPMSAVRDMNICFSKSQGISLQDLARLNEEIKAVVELSRGIGLGAINAGLISNKCNAGSGSRGFGVATAELRQFSGRLEEVMHKMAEAIFREISEAATLQKLNRRCKALADAEKESGANALSVQIASLNAEIAHGLNEQGSWREGLLALLLRAEQFARGGHITARMARLEAVDGGGLATTMTMAAANIEDLVLQALEIVKKLIARVHLLNENS